MSITVEAKRRKRPAKKTEDPCAWKNMEAYEPPAEPPADALPTFERAATEGIGKTHIATRDDCGADVHLWSIRTDAGQWMSELACVVPAAMRKLGLPSKDGSITPAKAGKFATRTEAEIEALERGIDWLQETRIRCTGEAVTLIDEVLAMLEQSIKEMSQRDPDRPARIPAPVAAATGRKNKAKRPALVAAVGSESQPAAGLVGARVVELPLDKIHRRPSNRGGAAIAMPDVADLVESIEALGLSQPIQVRDTSDEQSLPLGHYELIKGERRWTAFRALGRDTIPAIVLSGLSAREASIHAGMDNTQGRALDPIQRLREIQHAVDHDGCTLEEAALSRGIKPKQAAGDLRVLELPADLLAAIADGKLAISVARAMLPYREIPAAVKRFSAAVKKNDYRLQRTQDGDKTLRRFVLDLVREVTRPLDASTTYYAGYQGGHVQCDAGLVKRLDDEVKAKVKAVEVRIDNKPTLLATDVKAWEKENAAAAEERKKREAKSRKVSAKKAVAANKPANPNAEAEQDKSLEAKVSEWKHRFLRQAIAGHLVAGDYRTRKVARWVAVEARHGQYGHVLDQQDWLVSVAELRGLTTPDDKRLGCMLDSWDLINRLIPDSGDPCSDAESVECELTRLLLWPVAAQVPEDSIAKLTLARQLPEHLPALDREGVEVIAEYLAGPTSGFICKPWATRLQDAWARGRRPGSEEAAMIAALLSYPNRRQLADWVEEWGGGLDTGGKLDDVRAELQQLHASEGLKLLGCLGGKKRK
jgi:ParB/RepB/Spo0J family partition protein